jgi:hypothetical protein
MIHEIAMNDYERDVEIHELAILRQLAPKPKLGVLPRHPLEVLELESHSKPDQAHLEQPPSGARGHWKRLFACTILLRNVAFVSREDEDLDREFLIEKSADSVIRLVQSCIALGSQAPRLALGFVLWLHGNQSDPLLRPFVSFGALLLQAREGLCETSLLDTCAWVEAEENSAREQLGRDVYSARWLVGLNCQEGNARCRGAWMDTLAQVIAARSGHLPPEVETVLKRMLDRLRQ